MRHALDAWALIDYLDGREPALSRLTRLLGRERALMSWINLGEVFYVVLRAAGEPQARDVVRDLRRRLTLDLPSTDRVLQAATIKAGHALAYADAFAVATAIAHRAILLTGDPEILAADPSWPVEDVR